MVHVASAGGRHKMLAFASTEPSLPTTIDAIITVNTKDGCVNSLNSPSPSPSSSSTSEPGAIIPTELNRELHIIAEEPGSISAFNNHRSQHNNFHASHNGTSKMNQNEDGNNGNANYLADSLNLNRNMNTTMTSDGLQLISHGLTDSVVESLKLLDTENDNDGNVRIVEVNTVFTEEIVISTPPTGTKSKTKGTKGGIMKATGHICETHDETLHRSDEWKKHVMEDGSFSQSNDSEDTPLLPTNDSNPEGVSYTATTVEKVQTVTSNDSPTNSSSGVNGTPTNSSPPVSHKLNKLANGAKQTGLKRVSFGSSKGSMVETLVYENPPGEETHKHSKSISVGSSNVSHSKTVMSSTIQETDATQDSAGGSTGGSRPPSRVRVTFFESEKPLAVSSPESDVIDFDLSNMTLPGSPNAVDHTPTYNRQMSEGWDNPFRPDGDLSKEADQIVELIKEGKPINEETLRSKSPSVNESFIVSQQNQLNASPKGKEVNGTTANGSGGPDVVSHGVVASAAQPCQVENVVLKKKKGCCVIQ